MRARAVEPTPGTELPTARIQPYATCRARSPPPSPAARGGVCSDEQLAIRALLQARASPLQELLAGGAPLQRSLHFGFVADHSPEQGDALHCSLHDARKKSHILIGQMHICIYSRLLECIIAIINLNYTQTSTYTNRYKHICTNTLTL